MKTWFPAGFLLIALNASCTASAVTWEYRMNESWDAFRLGSVAQALESAERAMQYARSAPNEQQIATTCLVLGYLHRMQGDLGQAEALTAEGLSMMESLPDPDHEHVASARIDLAELYMQLARFEEADALLKRALNDALIELGLQHRYTAATLALKGRLLALQGNIDSAEFWYLQAIKSGVQSFTGTTSENFWSARIGTGLLEGLADVYRKQERFQEALALLEKLLAMRERNWGAAHPFVAGLLLNIGSVQIEQRRYADAETSVRRAVEINEQTIATTSPLAADGFATLAKLYFLTGRSDLGLPLIERAIAIAEAVYPPGHVAIEQYRVINELRRSP